MHYDMNEPHAMPFRTSILCLAIAVSLTFLGGCKVGIFDNEDQYWQPDSAEVQEINPVDLAEQSLTPPVPAEVDVEELISDGIPLPEYADSVPLELAEVRQAVLAHNLELQVELVSPRIAGARLGAEEAKFESAIFAGYTRNANQLFTNLEQGLPTRHLWLRVGGPGAAGPSAAGRRSRGPALAPAEDPASRRYRDQGPGLRRDVGGKGTSPERRIPGTARACRAIGRHTTTTTQSRLREAIAII